MHRLPFGALLLLGSSFVSLAACAGGGSADDDDDNPVDAREVDTASPDAPSPDAPNADAATDAAVDASPDAASLAGETCQTAELVTVTGGLGTATVTGTTAGYLHHYQPPTACTGYDEDGPDRVYEIAVPAGARLDAAVTPAAGYDAGIYLVATPAAMCDASPIVCLDGDDSGGATTINAVRYDNPGAAAVNVFIVIDGTATTGGDFSIAITVATTPPTPAGDTCQLAEAVTLTSGMATVTGTTATAANFANDYMPACVTGVGNDHVHTLTVPNGERLTATVTPQAGFDATLYLIGGPAANCDANPIVCLADADATASGGAETVTYDNTTGSPVEIMIVVDGYDTDDEGTYSMAVTVGTIPATPAGDTCQLAEAITLTGGVATVTGTTATASNYSNDYAPTTAPCKTGNGNDRVHTLTVPSGQRLTATLAPTGFDATLNLIAGPAASCDANPIVCLAGADMGGSGGTETVRYDNTTGAPVEVMIVVDGYSASAQGTYSLDVAVGAIPPPGPGDTCQTAEVVTLTSGMATVTGTTATAANYANDYEPPTACVGGLTDDGNDHVHVVTVPAGQTLTAVVTPTAFDASIYLVAGPAASCDANPIVCLAGADAGGSGAPETATHMNTTGAAVDVMIVVDSWAPSAEGAYSLAVTVM